MGTRERIALAWPPLFLRVGLAVTFIWAGSSKVFDSMEVQGERAALLANLGVIEPKAGGSAAPAADGPSTAPAPQPKLAPPTGPLPKGDAPKDAKPLAPPKGSAIPGLVQLTGSTASVPASPPPSTAPRYSAEQFAQPQSVRRVYGLALLLHASANPAPGADGKPRMALWPKALASGSMPVYFAWAAALTELVGGAMILVGLFTRFWALGLAGTMAAAMWLTEIGPAIQGGSAVLGVLPGYPAFSVEQWKTPMWQFALLMMSMALVCSGAGAASMDGGLSKPSSGGGEKPPAPK